MKSNIPDSIREKVNTPLHIIPNHPIEMIKRRIYEAFNKPHSPSSRFTAFDDLSPVVRVVDNFDNLLVPKDHPARSVSDTYYVSDTEVLRTQTSAHQVPLLLAGHERFLVTGHVFRRDEIDSTHYPVFHQMEGVRLLELSQDKVIADLMNAISVLMNALFPDREYKVVTSTFPFTDPSWEVEVKWQGKWIEVLGCGVIHPQILANCNIGKSGWAFGLGLERLAMILLDIPDIRLFWSKDERFTKQYADGVMRPFVPYSKYPACWKDISLWIEEGFNLNDLCEVVREAGGDLVEEVVLKDTFTHPKTGKVSHCYRINFRSHDRSLSNEEINEIYFSIRQKIESKPEMGELR